MSNRNINQTLKVLAQVLDDAVEYGYLDANPARGKRRRLKAAKPRRAWLELHELQALLAAAGTQGHSSRRWFSPVSGSVSFARSAGETSISPQGPSV